MNFYQNMRSAWALLFVLMIASFAFPASAAAQERSGFWFGVGGGWGSAAISCEDCDTEDREGSGVAYFKGGWTLNQQMLVGLEANLWSKDSSEEDFNATLNFYNFSGTVTYYPKPSKGFFVKGGAGVAFIDLDVKESGITVDLGKGLGLIVGSGFDIPVWRRVSITPAVNFWYGQPGDIKVLGTTVLSNFKQNVIDFTIGITIP